MLIKTQIWNVESTVGGACAGVSVGACVVGVGAVLSLRFMNANGFRSRHVLIGCWVCDSSWLADDMTVEGSGGGICLNTDKG